MSYILDALKKSEREKTLGQVPTLETVVADGAKRQSQGTPWWLNLLVFVLVLLGVLVGMYYAGLINIGKKENNFAATAPSSGETTDSQFAQQTPPSQIEQIAPEPVEQVQDLDQQVNQIQQEQQQAEPTAQQNNLLAENQQQVQSEPKPSNTEQSVEQAAELEEIAQAQQQTLIQQQAEELAALQQAQQQAIQEQAEEIPEQPEQNQQVAVAESNNNDYEQVLHQSLRNVGVNVVSYSSDARQRFVMLDLTIYKEGDSLPNGADIVQIQRTGAIVEFQNKRYLLKP